MDDEEVLNLVYTRKMNPIEAASLLRTTAEEEMK